MLLKKVACILAVLLLFNHSAFAEENNQDNLRNMFQNNRAIIYAINLRTFNANDKNENGIIEFSEGETSGSFINAIERLDEIKDIGMNTIHLLPITPTGEMKALGTAGSLYAISDFETFNPQLSDSKSKLSIKEQAKKLIEECHKRNIKVIVDLPSCGAYDLFLKNPNLFVLNNDGSPYIPADWTDVRLFDVPNDKTVVASDIYKLHQKFVDNLIEIGADGIRADVATIKPYIFWKELIDYTRSKNKDFLFLAEASEIWTEPVSERAYFTNYKKLLKAGFDGHYGDYFELKNWETSDKFNDSITSRNKVLKKYDEKKSSIGSFETHDVISPMRIGGENYSKIIIWLNATLPLNPYYIDGFLQGDYYDYEFSNKEAKETFTDDNRYFMHTGQLDIFNFSRKPQGNSPELISEHKKALEIRNKYKDVIEHGKYIPLKTDNKRIFAYKRTLDEKSLYVIFNRNLNNNEKVNVKLGQIKGEVDFIKTKEGNEIINSAFKAELNPGEIVVFFNY